MTESSEGRSSLWQQLINAELLPLSGHTVRMLEESLNQPGLSFKRIVPIINNDAALAAMLLKRAGARVAGSQFDVVDAVQVLGKSGIRAVLTTAPILRFFPPETQSEYQRLQLQGAFASRQSHALQAIYAPDSDSAINIAALLSCVVELHLISVRSSRMELLRLAARDRNMTIYALTEKLMEKPLPGLNADIQQTLFGQPYLAQALQVDVPRLPELTALRFGYQLAREVARGWQSREFAVVLHNMAKIYNSDVATMFGHAQKAMLRLQAEGFAQDTNLAKAFVNASIKQLKDHLDNIVALDETQEDFAAPATGQIHAKNQSLGAVDAAVSSDDLENLDDAPSPEQERAINSVSRRIDTQNDVNLVLKTVAEAVFQSLDFKRVTLAPCNPQRSVVKSLYQFGKETATWSKNFSFSIQKQDDNLIAWSMSLRKTMRVKIASFEPKELINDRFRMIINHTPECVIGPLVCDNKPIAVIYADLGIKPESRITGEQYKAFSRLIENANRRLSKLKP